MGKRAGQRAGRSAGFVTAKKVKGKKAKHEALHDEVLPEPAATEPRLGAANAPAVEQASPSAPLADPEAEHIGRLPLGPDDLDGLRALLVARRVRALRTAGGLHRHEYELEDAETQSAELMEKSTDRAMESELQKEAEAEQSLLGEVDAALARMEGGNYGVCEACGERVALPRLLAIPEARLCIRCAREASRMR
jgi:DnaK suppressor protein